MEWECATQTQMEFYSKHSSSSPIALHESSPIARHESDVEAPDVEHSDPSAQYLDRITDSREPFAPGPPSSPDAHPSFARGSPCLRAASNTALNSSDVNTTSTAAIILSAPTVHRATCGLRFSFRGDLFVFPPPITVE
eukprot:Selendium_serpulae@DN3332_c0_g1_i4.p1